jgi:molecular chaperone DnaK
MKTIAGIDLGTTYSAVAVMDEIGKPNIVADFDGYRLTPSVVHIPADVQETVNVGQKAKAHAGIEPDRVIQFVKRKMGTPSHRYRIDGREWSPVEISALILKKLKDECTELGDISDAVITVPAHFQEEERKATMDAGQIAGLNVLGIINEPTAAALYYATEHDVRDKVVVYDLGGGTFDVTVMDVQGQDITILV